MVRSWEQQDGEEYVRYVNDPKFPPGKGGYKGVGRPPSEDGYTCKVHARLSPEQKEKYMALGGSDFLRKMIEQEYPKYFTSEGFIRG